MLSWATAARRTRCGINICIPIREERVQDGLVRRSMNRNGALQRSQLLYPESMKSFRAEEDVSVVNSRNRKTWPKASRELKRKEAFPTKLGVLLAAIASGSRFSHTNRDACGIKCIITTRPENMQT